MKNLNHINLPVLEAAEMRGIEGGRIPAWVISVAVKIAKEVVRSIPNGTPIY